MSFSWIELVLNIRQYRHLQWRDRYTSSGVWESRALTHTLVLEPASDYGLRSLSSMLVDSVFGVLYSWQSRGTGVYANQRLIMRAFSWVPERSAVLVERWLRWACRWGRLQDVE
jgi:hypothetical protein